MKRMRRLGMRVMRIHSGSKIVTWRDGTSQNGKMTAVRRKRMTKEKKKETK